MRYQFVQYFDTFERKYLEWCAVAFSMKEQLSFETFQNSVKAQRDLFGKQ